MEINLTNTELAILGLIAESPKHGYQVEQCIEERGMREWTEFGFSSIYYVLNKMEENTWLTSEKINTSDRPARKVYQITETGLQVLQQAVLLRLQQPRPRSGDFDLALAYLPFVSPVQVEEALQRFTLTLHHEYDRVLAKWERSGKHTLPAHVQALFDHSLARIQTESAWLEKWITLLVEKY